MKSHTTLPIALTIAGSDSGGGAGIQADLKTFAALGVHGATAITCVTAQNPRGVLGVQACSPGMIEQQLTAVFAELPPRAVKTGMLFSRPIIQTVQRFLERYPRVPLVVDPVMVATSGARLLNTSAEQVLIRDLLPRATLVTPNLDEAAVIAGRPLHSIEDMRWAARIIRQRHGCAVLVKGGHLDDLEQAADVFYDAEAELLLTAPRIKGVHTHGTGCTYSAAICAGLANGLALVRAVIQAKEFITKAVAQSRKIAKHTVLHGF